MGLCDAQGAVWSFRVLTHFTTQALMIRCQYCSRPGLSQCCQTAGGIQPDGPAVEEAEAV